MGNFSNKDEKIIENKEKKNLDLLNIYTVGNINEIKKFNKKEINGEDYIEQELPYFDGKSPKNNWYFNFYCKDLDEQLINEIMNKIITDFRNKKEANNNIILIFLDSNEHEKNNNLIKLILEIFDKINTIYKPILLFAIKESKIEVEENKEDEENKYKIIDDIVNNNKLNRDFINKFTEIAYYSEGNYSEIIEKLSLICCYYNNISDVFSILDEMIRDFNFYHPKRINKIKYNSTFNILVIGRPGCGKSTLINLLTNKRKARVGIGNSITKEVSKYVHDKYPITFEDTPGFEDNSDLKKMIKFLEMSQNIFKDGKNKFHLILYLINGSNERTFIGEEVSLIKFIQTNLKVPIFFVCTKSKNEENAKDFKEVIKLNLWQNFGDQTNLIDNIYCCHLLNEKDGAYKRFGIDKLLNGIKEYYLEEIIKRENNLIKNENENEELWKTPNIKKNFPPNSIFLGDLKKSEDFEDYLIQISNNIIENYEYLTLQEELSKKSKNKKSKNNEKNDNNENNRKINELLVDHLALELNGQPTGKTFCSKNKSFVENNVRDEMISYSIWCLSNKTDDLKIKNEVVKDENLKRAIRMTKEFGEEAKKEFLKDLKEIGYEEYLKSIIENYKEAIESLPSLNDEIEN